jgi:(S)-2-hydroxyglutarate dehydrogenase
MYDIAVIGAGIVGLSTAWQLQKRYPDRRIIVLEKESRVACHQTGHNSGVIHAGVYYEPGSLKAQFCREGVDATLDFCREHEIAVEQCGKLLVATNALEAERMQALFKRCQDNGIAVELLSAEQLQQREPNIAGVGAIAVSTTGIVDYTQISEKMAEQFLACGGSIRFQQRVEQLSETPDFVEIVTQNAAYQTQQLIVCSGLQADRLVDMMDLPREFAIVPFRGEYYQLPADKNQIVNHLIYPIPDPEMPFLGVHLTRMIDGSVTVGPNAVLGWKREGYGRLNFSWRDTCDSLSFKGLWPLLFMHLRSGIEELKDSWFKRGYLKRVQKYCPQIELQDLQPYPAGIRAQAVMKDGSLVHDFLFAESPRSLHVCNAPSPAATSAIPIGNYLCEKLSAKMQ